MLLYLIVKNHAFVDGNKRIAAACFLLFLNKNQLLFRTDGQPILESQALASITLFVATSQPNELQTVKKLVISILNRSLEIGNKIKYHIPLFNLSMLIFEIA
jgi:prophage maintenance system killer protein